ncbi:CyP450 monooxygenase [Russula dissimulans]|nr:CyP450 monooxygenase [Russula dissimulans]
MPPSPLTVVDFLSIFAFLYFLVTFRDHQRRRGLPYPPGPPGWPVIGNLFHIPKLSPWAAYSDMSRKHGDIMCFRVLGEVIVVLCSLTAIKELLETRGEIYADRPDLPILEIMEVDWLLPIVRKGEYWRKNRTLLERSLRPGVATPHRRLIEEKTRVFLGQMLKTPKDFRTHIDFLQGKIIMSLVYGYELKENDDILVPAHKTGEIISRVILPGAALVNHLPFLRHTPSWIPWFKNEPMAGMCRELGKRMMNEPINHVKKAMVCNDARSLASTGSPTDEIVARGHCCSVAGKRATRVGRELSGPERQRAEQTTVFSMTALFVALILYPEVQRRAQAELDLVLSRDRLPVIEDKPRLPYIEAMCKELTRWRMVTPMGVPRASAEDDVYRGFFIPKGPIHRSYPRAVLHNPDLYPDPETFKPERFLNKDGTCRDDPTIALAFGAGKRICPGRHLVDATLFVFISSVLSVFNVERTKDENGNDIPVEVETIVEGEISPKPATFECSIAPRDKQAEDLIKASIWI